MLNEYSPFEEKLNIISHALGLVLSIVAMILLVHQALQISGSLPLISLSVFGISLIILYGASTMYHSAQNPNKRKKLKIIDHASIYILIAGTYTPFALLTLPPKTGWIIFSASWSMAIIGIVLKLFFTGKFNILSTSMYVFMGWIIIFAIDDLMANLAYQGFLWLAFGGISYTIGAVFYSIHKIKFNHAIFHVFVLAGSICHFISVYFYV